ncbi:outer-membrane lipoprotein carrier protein precursor [Sorangium cellulosum So ce56]|uniref:Outer-membrane lipoprotein carrier protein n=1 Tax=Sorangium cellulosum (strain So ce56) TaxID=448385 RepID=A9GP65_SORC5|nr:outer membrane lipoprotein carrier protein LolA [Sorangium cellulosum]CAN96711.1 outer-membrane lipoprotein carrier protein precursor [Sorangium cellulosum So ce56]
MNRLRLVALLPAAALVVAACDAPPAPAGAAPDASPSAAPAQPQPLDATPQSADAPPQASAPAAAASAGAPTTDAGAPADAGAPVEDAGRKREDAGAAIAARDAGTPAGDAAARDAGGGRAEAPAATSAPAPGTAAPPAVPPAEAGSADAVAAEVDAIFVGKNTYFARFKQEHTQKVSGAVKKQSGALSVQKPDRISFRYDPPNQNRIVSDGVSLKVYVAEDRQMFVTPVQNSEYPGALSFLMGHGLRPSFTFTFNDKAKFEGGPVLVGKPRAPTPHYEFVMFYIDKALLAKKDPGVVRRVLIVDAQGNRNRFDFENASQPASIDPAEFQFTAPPGTDVKQN